MTALLTACVTVVGANSLSFGPIAPAIAGDFSVSVPATMVAAGGYGLATALEALLLSAWIDQLGAKATLVLAMSGLCLAFFGSAASFSLTMLVLWQCVAGLAAGLALPSIYSLAASIAPPGKESAILGRVLLGWTLSMVGGVFFSAVVTDMFHWRYVFAALCLIGAMAAGLVMRIDAGAAIKNTNVGVSPVHAFFIPQVSRLLAVCFFFMLAFYGTYSYIGDHLHSALQQPIRAGGFLALFYGLGFGAAVFGDSAIDKWGSRSLLMWSMSVVAMAYVSLGPFSFSHIGLFVVAFLWGFANHFGLNLIVARLSAIDPSSRGAILGLNSAVTYLAASMGALAFGPLYQMAGFAIVAFVAAMLIVISLFFAVTRPNDSN